MLKLINTITDREGYWKTRANVENHERDTSVPMSILTVGKLSHVLALMPLQKARSHGPREKRSVSIDLKELRSVQIEWYGLVKEGFVLPMGGNIESSYIQSHTWLGKGLPHRTFHSRSGFFYHHLLRSEYSSILWFGYRRKRHFWSAGGEFILK